MNKTIWAVYSSWGGNTRLLLDRIQERLEQESIEMICHNAITASTEDLTRYDLTILAAPTYDHGILHTPFETFLRKSNEIDLTNHSYAVIGLGDDKYDAEYNVESATLLEEFVREHHGRLICESLKINKHPISQLTWTVRQRVDKLLEKIA